MVMTRYLCLACSLLAAANAGCVERRFLITSEVPGMPPGMDAGAMVSITGARQGPTPLDSWFVYYGNYHFTLEKDGYETLQVDQNIPAPWYEWPPLDFFVETIWPFKVRDVREFHYVLQPVQGVRPDDVLNRGEVLRTRGKTIMPLPDFIPQVPKPAPPPPAATTPPTLPPPRVLPPAGPPAP
jgi:hypothetical protein